MLTPKQTRFVAEYLIDLNATQAAIRCGYNARTAQPAASRLLSNVMVQDAVRAATARQLERLDLSAALTLDAIRRQVVGDIRNLFDADGNLIPISQLRPADAALIAGFEVVIRNAAPGDGHTEHRR
jgi:phage terminase small subunit